MSTDHSPPVKYDAYAVLKVGDFRLFLTFRFFTTLAFQMQGLIVGWQMYELTKDPLALGLIGVIAAVSRWVGIGFGPIIYNDVMRMLVISLTAVAVAVQIAAAGFLASMLNIRR